MKRALPLLACLFCFLLQAVFGQYLDPIPMNPDPALDLGRHHRSQRPAWQPQAGGAAEGSAGISGTAARPAAPAPSPFVDGAAAEEVDELPPQAAAPAAPVERRPNVPREQTRVAVLGYHNFSETKPVTEMLMRTSEFREQMEYIRRAGLTVISMQEFLEWRFGLRELPAECVLITLDDGWRSVYTDAYPILREYGYPFTLFLYTTYISGRGQSMTPAMIREMQENGASIGSHSVTHYLPSKWKAKEAEGGEAYAAMVDAEVGGSKQKLDELFGEISTYCYPGGYHTPPMVERLPGYGYTAAFTVIPAKVTCNEDPWLIHRYMVFGTDPSIFRHAMDFSTASPQGSAPAAGSAPALASPIPPFPVSPLPNSTAPADVPAITADLSGVPGLDISSVRMKVSGFGRVPAKVDAATRSISWVPPYRLYMPTLSVYITWHSSDGKSHKAEWSFLLGQEVPVQQ